jgi:hypothetical protein
LLYRYIQFLEDEYRRHPQIGRRIGHPHPLGTAVPCSFQSAAKSATIAYENFDLDPTGLPEGFPL